MMTDAEHRDVLELRQEYQRALRTTYAQRKTIRARDIEIAGLRALLTGREPTPMAIPSSRFKLRLEGQEDGQ